MSTLSDAVGRVRELVRDLTLTDPEMDTGHYEHAVAEAVVYYSKGHPRQSVYDYAGNGSTYDLSLPADWDEGFSRIMAVEYPLGEREPVYLDSDQYMLYRTASGCTLRLLHDTPAQGETVRLTYTLPHSLTETADTIPPSHFDAVVYWAAALMCREFASKFMHTQDPTMSADSVDYHSKADEASRLARQFELLYYKHLGEEANSDSKLRAATGWADWGYTTPFGRQGGDYVWHRRRIT